MKRLKKILKITGISLVVLLALLLICAHILLKPKSDTKVLSALENARRNVHIDYIAYKDTQIRTAYMQSLIDTTKSTLVFVHGSPGSLLDFKAYLTDSTLLNTYNMIAYDRVGYGRSQTGKILGSIAEEMEVLNKITGPLNLKKTVLIGYSYGGPVVLASPKNYAAKLTLAPAVAGDLEPQFWVLKLTRWKLTRWMVPSILRAAADEKASHLEDLPQYAHKWNRSPAPVTNVQGYDDWIVPYQNSKRLATYFAPKTLRQISLTDTGHALVWTQFDQIKSLILTLNTLQ